MPIGFFHLNSLDRSIFIRRGFLLGFIITLFYTFVENPIFNANSVDPDQTAHAAASDLGLNCL